MTDSRLAEALLSLLLRARFAGWTVMLTGRRTATGYTLAGSDTGYVWVRSTSDSWEQTQVRGDAQKANVPVWVGPNADGQLQIMDIKRDMAAFSLGAGASGAIMPPITPETVARLVFDANQIRPGRMRLSALGGLRVYIEPFFYPGGYWPGGDVTLTVPAAAGMQSWVGVALNTTSGLMEQLNGADSPLTVTLDVGELSLIAVPDGYIPLEALVLKYGQTVITGAEQWEDWRFHYGQGGLRTLGFVSLAPGSSSRNAIQPSGDYKALVVKNHASQTANPFEAQSSTGAAQVAITPAGGVVVNEQGNDADTRIEGDTATNLIFVDASQDAVGINQSTIPASAVFDVASTTKGARPAPSMTETQRNAIASPTAGLLVYNTSTNKLNVYNGSAWEEVGGSGSGGVTWYEPEKAPTSPNGADDEFDSGSLDGAWSWSTSPSATSLTQLPGWLLVTLAASNTYELRKAFTPGASTAFGLEVKLSFPGCENGDIMELAVLDSSNNHIADFGIQFTDGAHYFLSGTPNSPVFNITGSDVIVNGGFESSIGSEWTLSTVERSTTSPYSGSYCCQGTHTSPTGTPYARYAKQNITISSSSQFGRWLIRQWMRGPESSVDSGSNGRGKAKVTDPSGNIHWESAEIGGTSWQKVEGSVTVDETGTWSYWFTPYGSGGWTTMHSAVDLITFAPESLRSLTQVSSIWLRIYRDASNIYTFYWSLDGVTWKLIYTSNATSTTVSKVALIFKQSVSTSRQYGVSYIRRYA